MSLYHNSHYYCHIITNNKTFSSSISIPIKVIFTIIIIIVIIVIVISIITITVNIILIIIIIITLRRASTLSSSDKGTGGLSDLVVNIA